MSETVLDQIELRLSSAMVHNANAEVPPTVVLWPDRARQFPAAIARLRSRLRIFTLGAYDESELRGPAYWLRCVVAGTIDIDAPPGTPIIYLPGVGRDELRAIERCARALAPLAELQYRGVWFTHPNGKDWTVRSLFVNQDRGLGLTVADGTTTGEALLGAFAPLLDLPLRRLETQHIDAAFLHGLLNPDPAARILEWLDDPSAARERAGQAQWRAFSATCVTEYGFDPDRDGPVTAGRLLGERKGMWSLVWSRFADVPDHFSGVEERLRQAKPTDRLFAGPDGAWPQDNDDAEATLRTELATLAGTPPGQTRTKIVALWESHSHRRGWVWARLDRAPLVFALEHLSLLAEATATVPGPGFAALVTAYTKGGWKADKAFLAALQATAEGPDRKAVTAAAKALYVPWLDAHARALQAAIQSLADSDTYAPGPEASTSAGTVTVFADALRLDLAHRLADRLSNLDVSVTTTLAALPTVTDAAKPYLTPVPSGSLGAGDDLGPVRVASGAKATASVLRGLMEARGLQILGDAETGDPSGSAWTETATLDGRGHQFQAALVDEIDVELGRIAKRVKLLLDAGWQQVDIVTDHGWLLIPGGMEKVDLPAATVTLKKGRCARLKPNASVSVPTVPWSWNRDVRIAVAPGASCFEANQEYEHGGVSLQECVVPRVRVRADTGRTISGGAMITRLKWIGLLCRVEFENVPLGARVDIRAMPAAPNTSVAAAVKETTTTGKQALHVADEDLEGEGAFVVIVAADGAILAQREVTIGVNR